MLDIKAALNGTLRRMHYVTRYSSVPVINPENVAEHSWQVAMLSYLIGADINAHLKDGPIVNIAKLLKRAVLHDVSESMSGDIIRSYKHGSPGMQEATSAADRTNMAGLSAELGVWIESSWREAKTDDVEGYIVALADMLCVVSYCVAEHRLGNQNVDYILKAMYEEVLCRFHDYDYIHKYVDTIFPNRDYKDAYA